MDSIGSSLPSMPEPANPISMKQPPESLSLRKGRGEMGSDPALLMDKAAAQLAAKLQDSVLQKMAGHAHHSHERLKDLTSLMLNGDQDTLPKPPMLKGAEAPAVNGSHSRAPHPEPELKATIPQVMKQTPSEPSCANGTSMATAKDAAPSEKDERRKDKKRRGRASKLTQKTSCDSSDRTNAVEETEKPAVVSEMTKQPKESPSPIRFSVGDLVWTKVSGYPWWPCMVTVDPESNVHYKQKPKANSRLGPLYHVQYFGDAPERGFILEKNMVSFTGEDQYSELAQANKQPALFVHRKSAPSVPRKLKAQWNAGVGQAEEALGLPREKRVENFGFFYDDAGPHLNSRVSKTTTSSEVTESRLEPDAPNPATSPSQKKRRRRVQSETKARRRRQKTSAAAAKRKTKPVSSPDEKSEADSLLVSIPVRKERKKRTRNPPGSTTSQDRTLKKRRKSTKDSDKQASISDETAKKRRKRKTDGVDVKEPRKRTRKPKAPLGDDPEQEKPKRRRKRKQDEENATSKAKKRRMSACSDAEVSGSEECPGSPVDSLDGTKKGERKKEFVCQLCEAAGEDLVPCEGQCCGMFHLLCLDLSLKPDDKLLCRECSTGVRACFICKQSEDAVRRCHVPHCGKFYHEACVRVNPLTVFDNKGFRCPLHACLSCHYGCRTKQRANKGRLMRCLRCPVAYHAGDLCVAAGSEMITNTAIVCTNHFNAKKGYSQHSHVNVSWCFVCSKGGQLLCCESCPAAFHPDCLNIAMPDGSWFCNDCRAGKKPKYRDVIWVKLGTYRWWPAEIHHPRNIPTNIQHLRHEIGEFPVFFFGSKDYFWTHQGRVFPYMEGDRGSKHQRTGIGKVFKNALLEAESRFKEMKMKREAKEAQEYSRKPPPYKSIKVNKPFGKVQVYTADISEIPKCNCKPTVERPCGFESECLNRMLQYECHPEVCPSGERCCNQDFTKRLYPETKIIKAPGKGWGLVSLRDIKKGEFVNEYIGELIDEEECRARINHAHENNITDFYMLTIDKDRIIDAGPKGNYSRFMNHSCQPNCETQKWTVNGDTRVGLFAVCDIPAGTELTFNYNLDCLGNEKTICRCDAPNCSGFLGDRPKTSNGQAAEPKAKRLKRKYKKRKSEGKKSDDECFRCGDGGQLVLCDKKACSKAYHLTCLNLTKRPFGRWECPWHHCDVCGKNSNSFCQLCPNSFCKAHQEGALRAWPATGQLCCSEHEVPGPPRGPAAARPRKARRGRAAKSKTSRRKSV